MGEDKLSWSCAGVHLLLMPAPYRMFPGNQILRCVFDIAFHLIDIPEP